jgi:biopolymer transport protein ExbD
VAFETGKSNGLRGDINVTPLVDVCLVLLIIFIPDFAFGAVS